MSTDVIKTTALVKTFGSVEVLKQVDLAVPEHSIFGFLGPNGAGKTTTMKILLGLCSPTSGRAEIFGQNTADSSLEIRSRLGYLPQQPVFPEYMTAREVLQFSGRFFIADPLKLDARVDQMLELVGLEEKADRRVKGFSGGERQRLGIAQAQIHHPQLLILDEPAAALDPLGRHDVLRIMERLQKESTIFYSTHILDDVQQVSDTVAILNQGRLIAQGPIEDLLHDPGEVVYRLDLKGRVEEASKLLEETPWISRVAVRDQTGTSSYQVWVTDQQAAEDLLLRKLLSLPELNVIHFQRQKWELEERFMELVRRENHEN